MCTCHINILPPGNSDTESFECMQMLSSSTWTEQVDLYAVAATVHCLLHNEYMQVEVKTDADGVTFAAPKLALKRYWQVCIRKCMHALHACMLTCVLLRY